jgi:hypothetical protein
MCEIRACPRHQVHKAANNGTVLTMVCVVEKSITDVVGIDGPCEAFVCVDRCLYCCAVFKAEALEYCASVLALMDEYCFIWAVADDVPLDNMFEFTQIMHVETLM